MSGLYVYTGAGSCRSCKASILWFRTPTGSNIPIDDMSATDLPMLSRGDTFSTQEAREKILPANHFSTCPDADQHRKR